MISGKMIAEQVARGGITIEPFNEKQCGPNSYDIRLSNKMRCVQPNKFAHTDTHEPGIGIDMEPIGGCFRLMPGELYLASSIEFFGSDDFVPTIHGRSSAARHGLMVHLAAGFADCGWRGELIFELVNLTAYPMLVYPGDRIAQIAFERVEGEVDLYHSTYQGQRGIVEAKSLAD